MKPKTNGAPAARAELELLRGELKSLRRSLTLEIVKTNEFDRAQVMADWRVAQLEKRVEKLESRPS